MIHLVAQDCRLYLDEYDLSGDSNSVSTAFRTVGVEDLSFGDSVVTFLPGMKGWTIGAAGLQSQGDGEVEGVLYSKWDRSTGLFTLAPSGADGDVAYCGTAFQGQYNIGPGSVGQAMKWSLSGVARDHCFRGTQLHGKASRSATGNGTGYQLGALSATQTLWLAMHVFTATGTTLDVAVESDDNSGFTTATSRGAFAQVTTTATSELISIAGAVTDDYWRITYTITGAGPYVFAVTAGIL